MRNGENLNEDSRTFAETKHRVVQNCFQTRFSSTQHSLHNFKIIQCEKLTTTSA